MDARDRLHERAMRAQLVHPVRQRGAEAPEPADQVRVAEQAVLQRDAAPPRLGRAGSEHEAREVDLPPVGRRVRTVIEAELALIAEIDDFLYVRRRQLLHVAVDRLDVYPVEQHLERRTQRQTPATPAADVINPPQLPINRPEIPELRVPDIERSHV